MLGPVARTIHYSGDHFGWSHTAGGVVHGHQAVLWYLTPGELFEARVPKGVAPIAEASGRVRMEETEGAKGTTRRLVITPDDGTEERAPGLAPDQQ